MELPRIDKSPELADQFAAPIAANESGGHVEEVGQDAPTSEIGIQWISDPVLRQNVVNAWAVLAGYKPTDE